MISQGHLIKGFCEFTGGRPSWYVTTLLATVVDKITAITKIFALHVNEKKKKKTTAKLFALQAKAKTVVIAKLFALYANGLPFRNKKAMTPLCNAINSNRAFHQLAKKMAAFKPFLVENKD